MFHVAHGVFHVDTPKIHLFMAHMANIGQWMPCTARVARPFHAPRQGARLPDLRYEVVTSAQTLPGLASRHGHLRRLLALRTCWAWSLIAVKAVGSLGIGPTLWAQSVAPTRLGSQPLFPIAGLRQQTVAWRATLPNPSSIHILQDLGSYIEPQASMNFVLSSRYTNGSSLQDCWPTNVQKRVDNRCRCTLHLRVPTLIWTAPWPLTWSMSHVCASTCQTLSDLI